MSLQQTTSLLHQARDAFDFAQKLPSRPIYNLKELNFEFSERTAYRRIKKLSELGLVNYKRGYFTIKREVVAQEVGVLEKLIPSFIALTQARRFGRSYNVTDINFVMKNMPKDSMVTLEHSAYRLTKFQFPHDFHVYVTDIKKATRFLKKNNFSEGKKGNIVLMQKIGSFENEIERVFLDCLAKGGRSMMDAIAIQIKYKDKIKTPARFTTEMVLKVQEDLPIESNN